MTKRFESLDAFRGLCALAVVMYHMRLVGSWTELDFFRGSNIFVEFFFVLSGFVLAHGYGFRDGLEFKSFMKARFWRLYPLHFFMFLVVLLLEFGKLFAFKFAGLSFSNDPFTYRFALSEIVPNLLLVQSWLPQANYLSYNSPSWSISIEFYLYALLFASVVLLQSRRVLAWCMTALLAFALLFFESTVLTSQVLRGLLCFFGGAVTYVLYTKVADYSPSYLVGSIIEASLLALIIVIVQATFDYRNLVAPILFFITVLFFALESGAVSKLFKNSLLQYTGKLSYSIYMTHTALLFCLTAVVIIMQKVMGGQLTVMVEGNRHLSFDHAILSNCIVVAMLAFIVFVSTFTYKHVELVWLKRGKSTV